MLHPVLLVLCLGTLWIPQIIKNIRNQAKRAPTLPFIIITSIEHIYVPVFVNLTENNLMENEPNSLTAFFLIFIISIEVSYSINLGYNAYTTEAKRSVLFITKEMEALPL